MKHRLSFLLALLAMLSLGMSGCTSLPTASKLPSQYTVYPAMSHCTLHDAGRGAVWADIVSWLDARVPASADSAEVMARRQTDARKLIAETPEQAYRRMTSPHGSMVSWRPVAPETEKAVPVGMRPEQATIAARAEIVL